MHKSDERFDDGHRDAEAAEAVAGEAVAGEAKAELEAAVAQTFNRKSFFNHFNIAIFLLRD